MIKQTIVPPLAVLTARQSVGMTQTQAALVIGATRSSWQSWEYGKRVMPAAKFLLFKMLTSKL